MSSAQSIPPRKEASSGGNPVAGKLVVLGVFLVAIVAASFALWSNMSRSRRSLEFWGADAVRLIQQAPQVEVLKLEPMSDSAETGSADVISYGDRTWRIIGRTDRSRSRGLVHFRHSLTVDESWEFAEESPTQPDQWTHAVRFADPGKEPPANEVLILMDFSQRRVAHFHAQREITAVSLSATGWQTFVEREK
jgi:hypothetical protein